MLTSETASSVSTPSRNHGGDPAEERKIPAAAACVSVGELREAEVIFDWPRELRAMRMCDGLVVITDLRYPEQGSSLVNTAHVGGSRRNTKHNSDRASRSAVAGPSLHGYDTVTSDTRFVKLTMSRCYAAE